MNRIIFIVAVVFCTSALAAIKPCEELQAELDANLKAKGVKSFTLEILPANQVKEHTIIGSCEGGTKKIGFSNPLDQKGCLEIANRQERIAPMSKIISIYDNAEIPGSIGISTGTYTKIDGYRYVNISVEFEQNAASEAPVSLGVVFALSATGKLGSRRYVTYDQNFPEPADPQMITISGKNCWHGSQHNKSSYLARFPVMGPYLQVFPFNNHNEPRKFSVALYLTN